MGTCRCGAARDTRGMCTHCDVRRVCHQMCGRCNRRDTYCAMCGTSCGTKAAANRHEANCRATEETRERNRHQAG